MAILVTGGAGFIGSHASLDLLEHGYDVVVVDNLSNSSPGALAAVRDLTGREMPLHHVDLRDAVGLAQVFATNQISCVVHFAAKKHVGESVAIPLEYFDVNVGGTVNLLRVMLAHNVHDLVFSSSCSVYGDGYTRPITESERPCPVNPYARTKLVCEQLLESACAAYPQLRAISLRYFNPAGAHPSGRLGESPRGVPSNIVPHMMKVAAGELEELAVFGTDYDTADGSAVRDYIHVMDIAEAHRIAIEHSDDAHGLRIFNLGTGTGVSVLELIAAFERVCDVTVPYRVTGRRPGDVARLVADASLVAREWGWRPQRDLAAVLADAWLFQQHRDGLAAGAAPVRTSA